MEFSFKPKMIYGTDSVLELSKILKNETVLLVYGSKSAKMNGSYSEIVSIFISESIKFFELPGVNKPDIKYVYRGIELCKQNNITAVVGLGGCSVMDLSKMISYSVKHDNYNDYIFEGLEPDYDRLKLILIPTYPAGGSEADGASEVDDFEGNRHGSIYGIYSDYSILKPEYTYSLDIFNSTFAAFETFIQASAAILGNRNKLSIDIAISTISDIFISLNTVIVDKNNYDARLCQMQASAITTSGLLEIGNTKEFGYSIYELEGILEGALNISYREALIGLFPTWIKYISKIHNDDVIFYMKSLLGVNTIEEGLKMILDIYTQYHVKSDFKHLKYDINEVLEYINNQDIEYSELSKEELVKMYLEIL